jgi:hypothetical protein
METGLCEQMASRMPATANGEHISTVERQGAGEDLALAAHLLVVVDLERLRVGDAVEEVFRPVGLAHHAPRALVTAGIVLSRMVRSRKTDQRSR